jgi:hypothetical protein
VEDLFCNYPRFAKVHEEIFTGPVDEEGVCWEVTQKQFSYIPGAALLPGLQAVQDRVGSSPI